MKKVKINNEQSEFIEKMHVDYGKDAFSNYMRIRERCGSPLDDLDYKDVALVFNGWYEVVDTYKVGDYLYNLESDTYYKVTESFDSGSISFEPLEGYMNFTLSSDSVPFTKVNEDWKVKLLNFGRTRPEFKIGDKFTTYVDGLIDHNTVSENTVKIAEAMAEEDRILFFYPVESRIPFSLT